MSQRDSSSIIRLAAFGVTAALTISGCGAAADVIASDSESSSIVTHAAEDVAVRLSDEVHERRIALGAVDEGATVAPAAAGSGSTSTEPVVGRPGWPATPVGPGPVVEVSGGPLPGALAEAYVAEGGELVDPAEWAARFGEFGLPALVGPGVELVEATVRAERTLVGSWFRTDEAGWLAMSDDDRDAVVTNLVAGAGATGVPSDFGETSAGYDCLLDTYPADESGVEWTFQGCRYGLMPGLVSVGVSRTGIFAGSAPLVESTVGPVAEALGGEVVFVEARLAPPELDDATLHISAQVHVELTDVEAATAVLVAGPLAGWRVLDGESSALLSGPSGGTWTIAAGVAVFDWAGRW